MDSQHFGKSKKINNMIQTLLSFDQLDRKQKTKELTWIRNKKKMDIARKNYKNIQQMPLIPANANPRIFSNYDSVCSNCPFLGENQKARTIYSERAYIHKPNIVVSSYPKIKVNQSKLNEKQSLNRKFEQYDTTVSLQTGPMRRLLDKRFRLKNRITIKKQIAVAASNKLFTTFQCSKYDYYEKSPNSQSIKHLRQNSQRLTKSMHAGSHNQQKYRIKNKQFLVQTHKYPLQLPYSASQQESPRFRIKTHYV